MADIVSKLLKLDPGTTKSVVGVGFDDLRHQVEMLPPNLRRPVVLVRQIQAIPSTSQLIGGVLVTLATTARNLWPVWFSDINFGIGTSAADRAEAQGRIGELQTRLDGLSPLWARKAIAKVLLGQIPLFQRLPRAAQLHQLRLAISRERLVLVLALTNAEHRHGRLFALANTALWLARNAKLAVAVLLPTSLRDHPALAHITYDPIVSTAEAFCGEVQSPGFRIPLDTDLGVGADSVWVWLGGGRTHPHSLTEAKLAKALLADAELSPLFSANQTIETFYGNRLIVDLLWREGRVVIELDGPDHHEPHKYAADRRRDFELGISDFHVLRLVNSEVFTDTVKALAQIREVVRYRRRTRPELARLP